MLHLFLMRHAESDFKNYDGDDFNRDISNNGFLETENILYL